MAQSPDGEDSAPRPADQGNSAGWWTRAHVWAAVAALAGVLGAFVGLLAYLDSRGSDDTPAPPTSARTTNTVSEAQTPPPSPLPPPPASPRDPVRVLLAIDVSGSVNDPLLAGDPRTRIQAAKEWAPRALDALDERDQLGLATFSTSRPEPRMVVPIRSLTETQKGKIKAGLAGLRSDSWGTPLHQSIAWGVEQLQANWVDGTKQALVVLTDGEEHASNDPYKQELATDNAKSRLKVTDQAGKDVAVLITVAPPAAECSDVPKRFYDKCDPVITETDLRATLNGILTELGLTVPNEPALDGSQ